MRVEKAKHAAGSSVHCLLRVKGVDFFRGYRG